MVTGFILRAMEGWGVEGGGSGEWGRMERGLGEESAGPRGEIRWAH